MVSIIVLTYRPDPDKLMATLTAAVQQQGVDFEIILSDDGSQENHFALAEAYFRSVGFTHYRLVPNPQNKGTVQNCISGLEAAAGTYVFLTSPGDILYDSFALRDMYAFAQQNGAQLCFGNAVHYAVDSGEVKLTADWGSTANPENYGLNKSLAARQACFAEGGWIVGAAYFRQRTLALQYFSAIADSCVYVEDTTSTAFALADNIALYHCDRNVVWYEDGIGITTGGSDKWKKLTEKDLANAMEELRKIHPQSKFVDLLWADTCIANRGKRLCYKLLHHPVALLRRYYRKKANVKKTTVICTDEDIARLKTLLLSSKAR